MPKMRFLTHRCGKRRKFSKRLRIRLTPQTKEALEIIQAKTGLFYGNILGILFDGIITGNLEKLGLIRRDRGITLRQIPVLFPFYKTATVRSDIVERLSDEATTKLYTSRSFYSGVLLYMVIKYVGIVRVIEYVNSRPDIIEALTYGRQDSSSKRH